LDVSILEALQPVIQSIAGQVGVAAQPASSAREALEQVTRADGLLFDLTPDARETANAVQALAARTPGQAVDPPALARLLGSPAQDVTKRLGRTVSELSAKLPKL
jgi:hypothetical protein